MWLRPQGLGREGQCFTLCLFSCSLAASLGAQKAFGPLCPSSTSQPSLEPTSSTFLHLMQKAGSHSPFSKPFHSHHSVHLPSGLFLSPTAQRMGQNGPNRTMLEVPPGYQMAQPQSPAFPSLSIPAWCAGLDEVVWDGFPKASPQASAMLSWAVNTGSRNILVPSRAARGPAHLSQQGWDQLQEDPKRHLRGP